MTHSELGEQEIPPVLISKPPPTINPSIFVAQAILVHELRDIMGIFVMSAYLGYLDAHSCVLGF